MAVSPAPNSQAGAARPSPLVSVILPCYNVARYLPRCLDSLLANAYPDLEILIVDDGSTDEIADVCATYSDVPNLTVVSQRNSGVSAARNTGLDRAHGTYILFVDPDDYVDSSLVARVVDVAERARVDCVMFGFVEASEVHGEIVGQRQRLPKMLYDFDDNEAIISELFPRLFGFSRRHLESWFKTGRIAGDREFASVWRFLYRREIIERNGLRFDTDLKLSCDSIFNCWYLLHAQSMRTINECLYTYVQRNTGILLTQVRGTDLVFRKLALVNARDKLRSYVLTTRQRDISDWYMGSNVLSIFQICASMTRRPGLRNNYRLLKSYTATDSVRAAVARCPWGGSLKFRLPLLLAKARQFAVLLVLFKTLDACGVKLAL